MQATYISILGPKSFDPSAASPGLICRLRDSTLPLLSRGLRLFPLPKIWVFSFNVPFVCADCKIKVYSPGGIFSNSKFPFSSAIEYLKASYSCGFRLVPSVLLVATKFRSAGISAWPFTSHTLLPASGLAPTWKLKKYVSMPCTRPDSVGRSLAVDRSCGEAGGRVTAGSRADAACVANHPPQFEAK